MSGKIKPTNFQPVEHLSGTLCNERSLNLLSPMSDQYQNSPQDINV